jgi:hypothetical protein
MNQFIIPTNAHDIKNVELLKYIKIMDAAPICFGLQRNHHQGATTSTWLKLQAWFSVDIDVVQTLSVLWRLVIFAKYWLWIPDDGFFANRNILEQPP